MSKSLLVNLIANEFGLDRVWLKQFNIEELIVIRKDFSNHFKTISRKIG